MTVGLSGIEARHLGGVARPAMQFTALWTCQIGKGPVNIDRRFTAQKVEVLGTQPVAIQRFTQFVLQFIATRSPNYEWNPMILQDVFPNDISYNSVGSIRFATDVTVVDSGDDQRTRRWDQPLQEFDISYGVRTMEQLQQLIAFFRAMRGRLYAFNYRDWLDYTSSMAQVIEARSAPPISHNDQLQFECDGSTYRFQLVKRYTAPKSGTTLIRPITRPAADTVMIYVEGEQGGDWADHFDLDAETGVVTLLPRHGITCAATKEAGNTGAAVAIHADPGTFADYRNYGFAGVHRRIMISGFNLLENNVEVDQGCTIGSISDDNGTLYVVYDQGGTLADTSAHVTIKLHPAPPSGYAVYAGFEFFVPVRFDSDTLSTTLEDYGVGSSNSIKLVEVRPSAF